MRLRSFSKGPCGGVVRACELDVSVAVGLSQLPFQSEAIYEAFTAHFPADPNGLCNDDADIISLARTSGSACRVQEVAVWCNPIDICVCMCVCVYLCVCV